MAPGFYGVNMKQDILSSSTTPLGSKTGGECKNSRCPSGVNCHSRKKKDDFKKHFKTHEGLCAINGIVMTYRGRNGLCLSEVAFVRLLSP